MAISSGSVNFGARIDRDLNPYSQMDDFNQLLEDFRRRTAFRNHDENLPYLHPRILSYISASSKQYWTSDGIDGPTDRDIFDRIWRDSDNAQTRIGVFVTWPYTQVNCGIPWAEQEWHCWGAALVNNPVTMENPRGYGKHLYIWDCFGDMTFGPSTRPRRILMGAQRTLLEMVHEKYRLDGLWYFGGDDRLRRCLNHTAKWALSIAGAPDASFHPHDSRFRLFKRVSKLR